MSESLDFPYLPQQLQWLEALESGKYAQGKRYLHCLDNGHQYYCCLGVACELARETLSLRVSESELSSGIISYEYEGSCGSLQPNMIEHLKLRNRVGMILYGRVKSETIEDQTLKTLFHAHYNDLASFNDHGVSFQTIAKFIRANPTAIFTNLDKK